MPPPNFKLPPALTLPKHDEPQDELPQDELPQVELGRLGAAVGKGAFGSVYVLSDPPILRSDRTLSLPEMPGGWVAKVFSSQDDKAFWEERDAVTKIEKELQLRKGSPDEKTLQRFTPIGTTFFVRNETNGKPVILSPRCNGVTLAAELAALRQQDVPDTTAAKLLFLKVAEAGLSVLSVMLELKSCHCDIKPANLMLCFDAAHTDYNVRLIDFGSSGGSSHDTCRSRTIEYTRFHRETTEGPALEMQHLGGQVELEAPLSSRLQQKLDDAIKPGSCNGSNDDPCGDTFALGLVLIDILNIMDKDMPEDYINPYFDLAVSFLCTELSAQREALENLLMSTTPSPSTDAASIFLVKGGNRARAASRAASCPCDLTARPRSTAMAMTGSRRAPTARPSVVSASRRRRPRADRS
jgi:serine/threonine protein kinase